jgi:hypothetical protein
MKLLPDTPIKYNDDPPETVSRVKKHPRFLTVLAELVARADRDRSPSSSPPCPGVGDAVVAEWARLASARWCRGCGAC